MLLLFFCSTQCFHSMLCIFPSTQCFQPWIFAIPLLYFKASFKIQDKPMTCEDGNYKFAPCLCFAYGQFVCCNKLFSFSNHATKLQYQERSHGRQAYQVGQAQPPEKSVPYMSKSSLEQVLKFVKEEGVPELHSRKNMQEANQALTKQKTSSGPLLIDFDLVTLDGQTMPVQCTNLCTFLQFLYKQGGPWYQLLSKTMAQCQQKLHLVVYADEVTPGNVLAPITARKVWAIYASIKEFHTHLQNADAWVTLCIVRSSTIANVDGHLSQLLKAILCHWFNTCFLHLQGLQLEEPQDISAAKAYTRVFLHLGFFIMDGAAHKFALSMKGDSGSRFALCVRMSF